MYFKNFPNIEYRFSDIRTINMVDIFRSVKFTKKILMDVNYLIVDPDKWTIKEDNNNLIKLLIQN